MTERSWSYIRGLKIKKKDITSDDDMEIIDLLADPVSSVRYKQLTYLFYVRNLSGDPFPSNTDSIMFSFTVRIRP